MDKNVRKSPSNSANAQQARTRDVPYTVVASNAAKQTEVFHRLSPFFIFR